MASPQQVAYITQRAQALGLDPQAVLAIAGHEGIGGGIGDGGHAFGPFQMNNAGGVLTGKFQGQTPEQINQWAWSPQGVDYALGGISKVAGGLKGQAAIQAIATKYERPANPQAEIADAIAHYGHGGAGSTPLTAAAVGSSAPASINAGGSPSRQQLAQIVFGNGNGVDFNSSQIQTPNLVAISQLRQQSATGTGTVKGVAAPLASGLVSGGSQVGQSIAKTALSQLGQPYQFGGQAKLGHPTDCSGLLQEAAAAHGVNIPRTTYDQWKTGQAVGSNQLQPGDAVFFKGSDARGNLPGHVGIYIGGGKYVQDPHTGGTVSISTLADAKDFVGARRFA